MDKIGEKINLFVNGAETSEFRDLISGRKRDSYSDSFSKKSGICIRIRIRPQNGIRIRFGKIFGFEPEFGGFVFVSNPGIRWSLLLTLSA